MKIASHKFALCFAVVSLCSAIVLISHAQTPGRPAAQQTKPQSPAEAAAAKEQIWNSPNMLRARAWLQDYCSKSAKITPEMAKRFQTELANMTPSQMELWLLKFDHEEQQRQQQNQFFQQANSFGLQRAAAANQATQRSYSEFDQDQNKAADEDEQKTQEQREFSQSEVQNNQPEPMGPYYNYPAGLYPGSGGIHFHYHYYP